MIQRLLVASLGIAAVLGTAGMVPAPQQTKESAAPANKSGENPAGDPKNGSGSEKKEEKDQAKTKKTASA